MRCVIPHVQNWVSRDITTFDFPTVFKEKALVVDAEMNVNISLVDVELSCESQGEIVEESVYEWWKIRDRSNTK